MANALHNRQIKVDVLNRLVSKMHFSSKSRLRAEYIEIQLLELVQLDQLAEFDSHFIGDDRKLFPQKLHMSFLYDMMKTHIIAEL